MELINIFQNYGAFFEKAGAGITGPVQLKAENNGSTVDLSSQHWTYQVSVHQKFSWVSDAIIWSDQCLNIHLYSVLYLLVQIGLKGEKLGLPSGGSSGWVSESTLPKKQSLIWYKVIFIL